MMSITAKCDFVAASCSNSNGSFKWITENRIIYAAGPNIMDCKKEYCSKQRPIFVIENILKAEGGKINVLEFVERNSIIVSGNSDGAIYVWKEGGLSQVLNEAHKTSIVSLCSIIHDNVLYLASGSVDGDLNFWISHDFCTLQLFQTIALNRKCALKLAFSSLSGSNSIILACGSASKELNIYGYDSNLQIFTHCLELSGHRDWIRGLSFATIQIPDLPCEDESFKDSKLFVERAGLENGDLVLASASQDKTVRIWTIKEHKQDLKSEESVVDRKTATFILNDMNRYQVALDAVLIGHEEWVLDTHFRPPAMSVNGIMFQPLELLSCSADRSMIIWTPEPESTMWNIAHRMGDIGGNATCFEFHNCQWNPQSSNSETMAVDTNGAFHWWQRQSESDIWKSLPSGLGGSFSSVESVAWDPSGLFFGAVSLDQTCRVYVPFQKSSNDKFTFCAELARAQLHGYDLKCLSFLPNYKYVSAGDEKVLRIFQAPKLFLKSLSNLTGLALDISELNLANSASQPALGLSNRATMSPAASNEAKENEPLGSVSFNPKSIISAKSHDFFLTEEELRQETLWPEVEKLYGQFFEVAAVSAAYVPEIKKVLIASTCRSTKEEYACVRFWDESSGEELFPPLSFHRLTVTSLEFSPSGRYLLTAGRDRSWCLFKSLKASKNKHSFECVAIKMKAHSRIIWATSWHLSEKIFVTGSRDKTLKLWCLSKFSHDPLKENWALASSLDFAEAIRSVAFLPNVDCKLVAIGFENGELYFVKITESLTMDVVYEFPKKQCPSFSINSISWNPKVSITNGRIEAHLAIGSYDGTTRLISVSVAQ